MPLPNGISRRQLLGTVATGTVGIAAQTPATGQPDVGPVQPVPDVADGFAIHPFVPLEAPTALTFGPDTEGPDLYAPTLAGEVVRLHLEWTDQGPIVVDRSTAADGFAQPLGLAFLERGPPDHATGPPTHANGPPGAGMLVSDSAENDRTGRTDGRVVLVEEDDRRAIVDGLPNGRHNTNHLAFGPDGRLYITNGNTTDNGRDGGDPEVFPYSGAILAVDVDEVADDPVALRWIDDDGDRIDPEDIADHPVNADFADTVDVVAHGFRNIYGIAFGADGTPYTGMNGADDPASPDIFFRLDEPEGTNYGFPWCYDSGPVGATGDAVGLEPNPVFIDDDPACDTYATGDAVMGWHVCATGLDFPTDGPLAFPADYQGDAYIGECGPFMLYGTVERTIEDAASTRNAGSKVTRIVLDDNGDPQAVRDFVTGLALPTDVTFGPQGAMYIADVTGIYRVQATPAAGALPDAIRQ